MPPVVVYTGADPIPAATVRQAADAAHAASACDRDANPGRKRLQRSGAAAARPDRRHVAGPAGGRRVPVKSIVVKAAGRIDAAVDR